MKTLTNDQGKASEPLQVLLVSNNPLELASVYEILRQYSKSQLIIECCFDFKESVVKALKWKPACILVDDTFSSKRLRAFIDRINYNNRTEHIPITFLKSNNKKYVSPVGVQDYILKEGLSSERLYKSILKAIQFKKTQRLFNIEHHIRKRQFKKLMQQIKKSLYFQKSSARSYPR